MFKITLENIGPITKADLELGQITVIVGENNVGKSFVLKSVYSIFKAFEMERILLREDIFKAFRLEREILYTLKGLAHDLSYLEIKKDDLEKIKKDIYLTLERIDLYTKSSSDISLSTAELIDEISKIISKVNMILDHLLELIDEDNITKTIVKLKEEDREKILRNLKKGKLNLERKLTKIQKLTENIKSLENLESRLRRAWDILIKDVFSGKLRKINAECGKIIVNDVLHFNFNNDIKISIYGHFDRYNDFPRPIFIEGSILLEIRPFLTKSTYQKIKSLDTPIHISSFFDYIEMSLKIEEIDDELLEELGNIIKGDVYYDIESGRFYYESDHYDEPFDIQNVASGIKTFGILQLILKSGTFENMIYLWDEPESHLHPEWQIKFAEIVAKLVKRNNYFVISTHSPFMVEILRVVAKENEIDAKFYYMDKNSELIEVNDENWDIISDSLLRPLRKIAFRLFRVV